jgi:predicted nucleic acid-binding Zn ribbon protein
MPGNNSRPFSFVPATRRKRRQPHEQALYEWRRSDPEDPKMASAAQPISAVMPKLLTGIGLDRRRSELEILRVWNNLIDPSITAHAHPVNVAKGTLFVNVDNSMWLDEIVRYRRKEILQRLQHSFGKDVITKISFRLG